MTTSLYTLHTGHVGLNVSELDRSISFYQAVFGFELKFKSDKEGQKYAFLGDEKSLVLTLWEQSSGSFEKNRPGLHHLSFQVDSLTELQTAQSRLEKLGVEQFYNGIVPHNESANSGGLFFIDPDGIRLEIFTPTGANIQAAPSGAAPTCGFF